MPNPNNNNENQMTEARKNLYMYEQQMEIIRFDDAALNTQHRRFTEALHALSRETDRYYTRDEQGNYPVMDGAAFAQFDNLYRQVYGTAASLKAELEKSNERKLEHNDRVWKAVYGALVDSLQDVLGRDLQHLHSVQRQGNETLPALIEQARIRSYDIDGQQLERVGGNLSSRLGFSIPGPEGEIRGFFTESVTTTEMDEIRQLEEEMKERNPRLADLLTDFKQRTYFKVYEPGYLELDFLKEHVSEEIGKELFRNPKRSMALMDAEFRDFNEYLRRLNAIHTKYNTMDVGKLGDNDRVDLKNCAMTTVADLLDMKGLLAHATPVEITYTEDGKKKTKKGSFMQFAEGEDLNRQVPGKGLMQSDAPASIEASSLKRQLADLQVLDYICGNMDRNQGNMMYKLDESDKAHPKVVGVQGIDNDASFTTEEGRLHEMVAPSEMLVIRRRTAELVEGLTPDMLKTMLRNFNLKEEQLDAVWTRTRKLQEAIQSGRTYFEKLPKDELKQGQLHVLEDEDFDQLSMDKLSPKNSDNYFGRIRDITDLAIGTYIAHKRDKLTNENLDAAADFFKHSGEMKALQQELQEADSVFRKRPEYRTVLNCVEELSQADTTPLLHRKKNDIEQKMAQIEQGLAAANAYINHKQEDYNREMQAARGKGQKAVGQCEEKYKGKKSADARRIRAVAKLRQKLSQWKESGKRALQLKEDAEKFWRLQGEAYIDAIREEMEGKRTKVSVKSLREKFGMAEPAQERKTVFRQPAQQKEVKRSNSMQS